MFNPQVGEIPRRRERLPTPVFWPGEFHGLYGPRSHKDTDMTEQLSLSFTFTRGMKIALWGWMGLWWWRKRQPRTEPYLPLSLREWKKDAVAIKGIKGSHWEVGGNRDGNLGIPGEISNSRDQSKSLSPTEVKSDDRQGGRGVCGNYKRKLKFSCSPELYSDNLNPISEKAMATHSSTLAWKIPWVEEPDRLQSMDNRVEQKNLNHEFWKWPFTPGGEYSVIHTAKAFNTWGVKMKLITIRLAENMAKGLFHAELKSTTLIPQGNQNWKRHMYPNDHGSTIYNS